MRDAKNPGLTLDELSGAHRAVGVRFTCMSDGCRRYRDVPFATVIDDLRTRQVGGRWTRIREVAKFARKPCEGCGGVRYETGPAWS